MSRSDEWRRAGVGLASGLFQSPSYLLPQFVAAFGAVVGASAAQLAWVAPLGYVLPVLVGLLLAAGDWFGARRLILWTAALTTVGAALLAASGVALAQGARGWALGLAVAGACLVPAAVRQGALVTAHETSGLPVARQLSASRALRRYLVLGLYGIPLPLGLLAEHHGWAWAFGSLAAVQVLAVLLLVRIARPDRPVARPASLAPFVRELGAAFADRRLCWAAGGGFAAQATVFAYVGGLPVVLLARGWAPGVVGAVAFAAVLAALFVAWPRSGDGARLARWACVVPVAGLLGVGVVSGAGAVWRGAPAGALALGSLAAFALTSVLVELTKQWSQAVALVQARIGATSANDYRRQAVVGLGANLGALAGAGIGPWSASAGEAVWAVVLIALSLSAWGVQAAWFATDRRSR